ncbi:uncharacterized protein [Eurosta solidaginis]|uniref:uncharacterized protein n=1 Tax=Eurosta solidaginis TaxID=178769 RepID=UPI003531643D
MSNFVNAFKEYGIDNAPEMEDDDGHDMSEFQNEICLPKHHRCSSHTLNLLVTSDLIKILKADESLFKRNNMVFKKCDNLWKKCKWPKSSEVIQETLGGCLVVPVGTRWNSLYDAVVRLLQHRPKLDELCDKLSLPRFTSCELSYLDTYKLIVAPIAQSLDFMQGEQSVGYGSLLPTIMTLSKKLIKIQQKIEHPFSRIALELEEQLRQRFRAFFELNEEADLALAAAALTPNVKLSWLKILQKTSPQFTYERITERVIRIITDYAIKQNLPATNESHKCEGSYTESTFYDFSDGDYIFAEESTASLSKFTEEAESMHLITNMMHQYLNDTDKTSNIWFQYPTLKEISLFCNTPLTSSGPVERLFSFAGIINSPRRGRLTDFSFEKLELLKANIPGRCSF